MSLFTPKYFLYADGAEHIAKLANQRTDEFVALVGDLLRLNKALRFIVLKDRIELADATLLGERMEAELKIIDFLEREA